MRPLSISCILITTLLSISNISSFDAWHGGEEDQHEQESDRVHLLPGQPQSPPMSQFSGYVTVNKERGRALFYWFYEAQTQPTKRPLLLWLNGGPGCSSIGYGMAVELGPLRVKRFGDGLEFNKYAWNQEANLLFLESPIGVGFSYTNTTSDFTKLADDFVADDAYSFLVNWLKRFPQYKAHDFYISGESYAGHYVPQLAELVYERNKDKRKYPHINLKGFMVGNPETNDYYDYKGLLEYAWSHTVVSDQIYDHAKRVCNFNLVNWTNDCSNAMNTVFNQYKEIDIYNIYEPICNVGKQSSLTGSNLGNSQSEKGFSRRMRIPAGYDPCYSSYVEKYLNKAEVQRSIHANVTGMISGKWKVCNDSILNTYNYNVFSVLPIYAKLVKAGINIWIYSGDADGRVPVIGSRYCVEALGLPLRRGWQPWYHNSQVGGRFVEYHGLTMVTVRGAGHLVPLNKPSEALVLIRAFLTGKQLPVHR